MVWEMVEVLKDFDKEVLSDEGTVLVEFFGTWCGPCKMMDPLLQKLAESKPALKVLKADIGEMSGLMKDYNIRGVPTFILFEAGYEQKRHVGALNTKSLNAFVEGV